MTSRRKPAAAPQPRWKFIENVVAAIEGALAKVDGTKVTRNASVPETVSGELRQVDYGDAE